jgi:ribosome biogenesis GTPase A
MESPDIDVFKLKLRPPPLFNQSDKDNDMILGAKHYANNSQKNSIISKNDDTTNNQKSNSTISSVPNILSITHQHNEPVEINEIMKILIVGNAKCGKSSIINRYTSNSFESKYKTTIGADFIRKDGNNISPYYYS